MKCITSVKCIFRFQNKFPQLHSSNVGAVRLSILFSKIDSKIQYKDKKFSNFLRLDKEQFEFFFFFFYWTIEVTFGKKQQKTHQRSQKRPKTEKKEAKQHRTGKTNETEPKIEKGHALIQVAILKKLK